MSEYSAKTLREKSKAKARSLANPGIYAKDQEVSSADWSPAPPLRTEVKTGARPIMRPSAKGTGESYAARDTKAAIGKDMKRGAFKRGGAVKRKEGGSVPSAAETEDTKSRLGDMKIKPVRGAAQHYKKGGKIKKAGGGSFLEKMVGKPKTGSDISQVGKMGTANYTQEDKGALNRALKGDDSLPEPAEAAERSGKYQNYKKGGRTAKAFGGSLIKAMKGAKKAASKKGGKTDIKIVINAEKAPARHAAGMSPAGALPPPPPPPMGAGAPSPAMPPMGGLDAGPMVPPGLPIGRKAGGRITKVAKSYKDMEAGSGSGEGRLQKTDIAKLHRDAPARKAGGRISKVAKSYKDMTAGAGSGEGRLQKEDIAKAKKGRGK